MLDFSKFSRKKPNPQNNPVHYQKCFSENYCKLTLTVLETTDGVLFGLNEEPKLDQQQSTQLLCRSDGLFLYKEIVSQNASK